MGWPWKGKGDASAASGVQAASAERASSTPPPASRASQLPPTPALLEKLRGFHELARDCLSRAATVDESGAVADALRLYSSGVDVCTEGLALPVPPGAGGAAAQQQRAELASWQAHARDRVRALGARGAGTSASAPRARSAPRGAAPAAPPLRAAASAPPALDGEAAKLRALVESEVLDRSPGVRWADIAGLEEAKRALHEAVVLPTLRADLFTGLRAPAKGLLLFGPPGTGKTLLAKAVATESNATFFAISAASLTSKWVGEAEKLVRALFALAEERAPSVVFVDEIDSILSARSSAEHEASRRLKTEFLVQMDGAGSDGTKRVVVLGATNRPEELDEAVRRRLVKRIYIPLPDAPAREALLRRTLAGAPAALPPAALQKLVAATNGYSGSDLAALCREAALAPLRELPPATLATLPASKVRPISLQDCEAAMRTIRPSVDAKQLKHFEDWDKQFGAAR
jgi:spastin